MRVRDISSAASAWACVALAALAPVAWAGQAPPFQPAGKSAPPDGNALVAPRLALAPDGLAPRSLAPGDSAYLAIIFDIEPGWHMYWMNPGDTGLAPEVALALPEGVAQTGEILWPYPTRYPHSGFMVDNIYEDQLILLAPIKVSPELAPGATLTFRADLNWLVCADVCLPGSGSAALTTPIVGRSSEVATLRDWERIRDALSRVPAPAEQAASLGVAAAWEGATLVLRARGADAITYFHRAPHNAPPRDVFTDGSAVGDSLRLAYPERVAQRDAVSGVVVFTRDGVAQAVWITAPTPTHLLGER